MEPSFIAVIWTITSSVVTLMASLWITSKVHSNRISRMEKDIDELNKLYEDTEKEMLSRLRVIEMRVTELATMLGFLLKNNHDFENREKI